MPNSNRGEEGGREGASVRISKKFSIQLRTNGQLGLLQEFSILNSGRQQVNF